MTKGLDEYQFKICNSLSHNYYKSEAMVMAQEEF